MNFKKYRAVSPAAVQQAALTPCEVTGNYKWNPEGSRIPAIKLIPARFVQYHKEMITMVVIHGSTIIVHSVGYHPRGISIRGSRAKRILALFGWEVEK